MTLPGNHNEEGQVAYGPVEYNLNTPGIKEIDDLMHKLNPTSGKFQEKNQEKVDDIFF